MAVERLTHIGTLLADQTRATLLTTLMDGRARTGGELAKIAHVAPSTASEHLSRLVGPGLVRMEAQGRHRYFHLADPEIARMLESLGATALPDPPSPRVAPELTYARSCYDHLAGELAVRIYGHLLAHEHLRLVDDHLRVTESGEHSSQMSASTLRRRAVPSARPPGRASTGPSGVTISPAPSALHSSTPCSKTLGLPRQPPAIHRHHRPGTNVDRRAARRNARRRPPAAAARRASRHAGSRRRSFPSMR
jgi:DNA-binding transcriptional ArsR family regulator